MQKAVSRSDPTSGETLEITSSAFCAWLLIGFSGSWFCLGLLLMLPRMPRQDVASGLGICTLSAAAIAGGCFWLKHLPVQLRLTPDELQFPGGKQPPIPWVDIERVDVRTIRIHHDVSYLCVKLKPDAPNRRRDSASLTGKLLGHFGADDDLFLDDQRFNRTAEWLAADFNRRISLAVARRDGLADDQVTERAGSAGAARGRGPERLSTATYAGQSLGPLVMRYSTRHWGSGKSVLGGLVCLAIAGTAIALPHLQPPKPGDEAAVFALFYILGGVLTLSGLAFLVSPLLKKRRRFAIHRDGLSVQEGRETLLCRWEDVHALSVRVERATLDDYLVDVIKLTDGDQIEIDPHDVKNADDLVRRVGQAVSDIMGPQLVEKLTAGNTIILGTLVLTREGIQAGQHLFVWRDIRAVAAERFVGGRIIVHIPLGPVTTTLRVHEVPNLPVIAAVSRLLEQ